MNLIQKIKSYFIKQTFSSWKDFHWEDYDIKFKVLTEEMLLDIGRFIKHNLDASQQIGNKRHRLTEESTIECRDLDELLPLVKHIITTDYLQTSSESNRYNWDFRYFVSHHELCENTICISNGLKAKGVLARNCIYPLITVRKHGSSYFCWNHLR